MVNPTFWQQLWNKGADISAQVISTTVSAGIVASIATLTWQFKRKRDLELEEEKERQKIRLKKQIPREEQEKKLLKVSKQCKTRLDQLADRLEAGDEAALSNAFSFLVDEHPSILNKQVNSEVYRAVREAYFQSPFLPTVSQLRQIAALLRTTDCTIPLSDNK